MNKHLLATFLMLFSAQLWSMKSHNHLISTEEGYFIYDEENRFLKTLSDQSLIIDHLGLHGYEVYGPKGLEAYLRDLGVSYHSLNDEKAFRFAPGYPTPEEVQETVQKIVKANQDILKYITIGTSKEGRDLYVVKLSDNVEKDEYEPEFKYIANMHGDEIVGREILVLFLEDIVKRYRAQDPEVKWAIEQTEIFIMPTMNPDGSALKRRGNQDWKDLNRNFPDFTTSDNQNTPQGRELETQAVMNWQAKHHFSLSANFHGGSKVVNYPWDTSPDEAPLTELIKEFSLLYASTVPGFYDNRRFENGIVNGYKWYHVDGGMQDWSYFYHNDLQVTVELSHPKWPNYGDIPQYYTDNSKALLQYLLKIHQGAGFYLNDKVITGEVSISDDRSEDFGTYSFHGGEFYKVLPPGLYTFDVKTKDGKKITIKKTVSDILPTTLDHFSLFTL